ncbi:hypothetical protein LshimejAT787_0904540 [Lyophyllum shimeji]|uniref:Uncharacterized protein n=1 Tax=Lyophyllum shimeji TaxID=47721 RepID=A0A9P3PTF1_LYOSH|nr:hypothetical protein LshimejAT787_0904540 [Lyophyllum shimeji]
MQNSNRLFDGDERNAESRCAAMPSVSSAACAELGMRPQQITMNNVTSANAIVLNELQERFGPARLIQ